MNADEGPDVADVRPLDVPAADGRFGVYVHVPFCSVRCGYCDFNTYTADELGEGATRASYADTAVAEVRRMAATVGPRPVETVFFGGGTPTQLPAEDLVRIVRAIDDELAVAPDAEVTSEANPDSVTPASLATMRAGGFNRISFGVQSAVPHVLATLDRTHDPERVPQAVQWAREAGFEQVSVDLIYGTPGESMDDWRTSLEAAVALEPDHVSAYALIVEDGTAFARKVRRGEVTMPDDDETADKYLLADDLLTAAGLGWYELSNWATGEAARCRHNLLYWRGDDWWGVGPGAHSHLRHGDASARRWWNVKHPAAYAQRLTAGQSPEHDGEDIDAATAHVERVMLEVRLRDGLALEQLDADARDVAADLERRGLCVLAEGSVVLTRSGRLLADAVVRELLP
ncbi:radical SAM family heme chaperone HemW [Aeromicrobium sp. CTD01-1L150]|uniref:radical SAM family heme chaperone HemW n=1 Tax=Aeromicrobium sp. CTD01-1L150 TaxID=3341830 RepID=UPI0035C18E17